MRFRRTIAPYFAETDYYHFKTLRGRLDANLQRTHRTQPVSPATTRATTSSIPTWPVPICASSSPSTPFEIPEARRFEHSHIVAGSGHGETQTLQYFIARDIEAVERGDKSIVVIDSQGDLINTILKARTLPPEQIVLIDPEDIGYPVCLNLFSVGQPPDGIQRA